MGTAFLREAEAEKPYGFLVFRGWWTVIREGHSLCAQNLARNIDMSQRDAAIKGIFPYRRDRTWNVDLA